MSDFLSYRSKRVIVTGCFSGMGAATASTLLDLGAEVHGLDYKAATLPLASFTNMDLRDPASIDAAAARIEGPIDALFNCAGVPTVFPPDEVFKVNFVGTRYLTEALLPKMAHGSAIACIASTAGMGWGRRVAFFEGLMQATSYEAALDWRARNSEDGADMYSFSKEALIIWVLRSAASLVKRGIRMNCILPGSTETPFVTQQSTMTPRWVFEAFAEPMGRLSTPEEQASALVFLNSAAAAYINGVALPVDGGFTGAVATEQIDVGTLLERRADPA